MIRRLLIPRSALVSPAHRLYPSTDGNVFAMAIVDDADYDPSPLTDEEFAAALPAGTSAMHPEMSTGEQASS